MGDISGLEPGPDSQKQRYGILPGAWDTGEDEAIAVIGFASRLAGDATDNEKLWQFILDGRSASGPFPDSRFGGDKYFHPDPEHGGSCTTKRAHFLTGDIDCFDAPFFNLSELEVAAMDPQQKLLLENVYHALENAGIIMQSIAGSRTSAYVGVSTYDHLDVLNSDLDFVVRSKATGAIASVLANRVSWFYDLKGTSLVIDTACSSSLVALHQACTDLLGGGSDMSIVSGVNILQHPAAFVTLSGLGVLSPDGQSYSFDENANGYARGEGVITVIIKRLSAAVRDGDTIRAILRGTGSNSDGRTPGISQPCPATQAALIKEVYARAGIDVNDTAYVEAHGTGTQVGDPLEVSGLTSAFRPHHRPNPLYIGSIKANLGHLEGGAGLAAVVKAIQVLENRVIPPVAKLTVVSKRIPPDHNVIFPQSAIPWPMPGIRRVSINSFGLGGTNAHVVLEDADRFRPVIRRLPHAEENAPLLQLDTQTPLVLVLSAGDENGLQRVASQINKYIEESGETGTLYSRDRWFQNLAYTLSDRRSALSWRSAFVVKSAGDLSTVLCGNTFSKFRSARQEYRLGFVFTGQGAQWLGMGRTLMRYPVFRASIDAAAVYLHSQGSPWNLADLFGSHPDPSVDINQPLQSQTACTALQVALVDLLLSWNVAPGVVIGHSSGEIAAAYCASHISREEAWMIAYFRGVTSSLLQGNNGAMIAIGATSQEVLEFINRLPPSQQRQIQIGCFNSPRNVTVTGHRDAVVTLQCILDTENIFNRLLPVNIAYHSMYMTSVSDKYRDLLSGLCPGDRLRHAHPVAMISTVTGRPVLAPEVQSPNYWVQNLECSVQFSDGILRLADLTTWTQIQELVEIGPHSALQSAIRDTLATHEGLKDIRYNHVLTRKDMAGTAILEAVGGLWARGYAVNLNAVNSAGSVVPVHNELLTDLPPYAFNHEYKMRVDSRRMIQTRMPSQGRHELLGSPDRDWDVAEPRWRNYLRPSELPWLRDNMVDESIIFPGVGSMVMAIEATRKLADSSRYIDGFHLSKVVHKAALIVPDTTEGVEIIFALRQVAAESSSYTFALKSYTPDSDSWTEHSTGLISIRYRPHDQQGPQPGNVEEVHRVIGNIQAYCTEEVDLNSYYQALLASGFELGPTLQTTRSVKLSKTGKESLGVIAIPNVQEIMPLGYYDSYLVHPATMESMVRTLLHTCTSKHAPVASKLLAASLNDVWVSASISSRPDCEFTSLGSTREISPIRWSCDVDVWDEQLGQKVLFVHDMKLSLLSASTAEEPERPPCFNLSWQPYAGTLTPHTPFEAFGMGRSTDPTVCELHERYQVICTLFIERALQQLGDLDVSALPFHYRKFWDWLQRQHSRLADGLIPYVNSDEVARLRANEEEWQSFCGETQALNSRAELLVKIGVNIVPILQGDCDPLQLMFGDEDLMPRNYDEGLRSNVPARLTRYLDILAKNRSPLNVLEIGAGTGSATIHCLGVLAPLGDGATKGQLNSYTFTDLSVGFLDRARTRFQEWEDVVEYKILNIENDPVSQGFEVGSYDVIVATHVLHATANLRETLANAHSLLKPGGKLLMIENVQPELMCTPLSFGVLSGWWNSVEESRAWNPLIGQREWTDLLDESGFSKGTLVFKDSDDAEANEASLFISTAVSPVPGVDPEAFESIVIVAGGQEQASSPLAQHLAGSLRQLQQRQVRISTLHDITESNLSASFCLVLCGLDPSFDLSKLSEDEYRTIQCMMMNCHHLLWVSEDEVDNPKAALATGLIRTIRWERAIDQVNFVTLRFQHPVPPIETVAAQATSLFAHHYHSMEQVEPNGEFLFKDGIFWTLRLKPDNQTDEYLDSKFKPTPDEQALSLHKDRALEMQFRVPGKTGSLVFTDDNAYDLPLGDKEINVLVHASGLNGRDVKTARGESPEQGLGIEAAGVVAQIGPNVEKLQVGDRVMLLQTGSDRGTIRRFARAHADFVHQIPDDVDLAEAAAVPVAFCTALHTLYDVADVVRGEKVLIDWDSDGVAHAACQLVRLVGAEAFVMIDSVDQNLLLKEQLRLPDDRILSRSSGSIESDIKNATGGHGFDVVLHSVGHIAQAVYDSLAPLGRFVTFGEGQVNMKPSISGAGTYSRVDLTTLGHLKPAKLARVFSSVARFYQGRQITAPAPRREFSYSEIVAAVSHLQDDQAVGKAVLVPRNDDVVPIMPRRPPPFQFQPNASYVVAGGLGGLGRSLARWMCSHGARHLILISRTGVRTDAQRTLVEELHDQGCEVQICRADIVNGAQLAQSLSACASRMPPTRGCFQSTMILEDSMFANMSHSQFKAAIEPKVQGSLHLLSALPESLDFFVMLSSVSSVMGNRGQANYSAANAFEDALAAHLSRTKPNITRAVSINLGSFMDIGWIAENDLPVEPVCGNTTESELHALVEYHLDPRWKDTATSHLVTGLRSWADFQRLNMSVPEFMLHPLFSCMRVPTRARANQQDHGAASVPIRELLRGAETVEEAVQCVVGAIVQKLCKLMSLAEKEVDSGQGLAAYGVDSLVTVDLRTWIAREMGSTLSTADLIETASILELGGKIAQTSKFTTFSEST